MALTCGFYNSLVGTGDRKYDAKQISSMFDGIINDGVFSSVGNAFHPTVTGTNNTVSIGTGKAWFNHTWTLLDTILPVVLDVADPLLYRMDTIYLEVDTNDAVRANSIKVAKGATYAAIGSPVYAAMVNDGAKFQYPLVNVQRRPAATTVLVTDLNYAVSTFVNGLFAVYDSTAITASWNSQFTTWFNSIKAQIGTDLGTSLATRISALETLTAPWVAVIATLQTNVANLLTRMTSIESSQPRASWIMPSATQTIASTAFPMLVCTTASETVGTGFTNSGGAITVANTGTYEVSVMVSWPYVGSSTSRRMIIVTKNCTGIATGTGVLASGVTLATLNSGGSADAQHNLHTKRLALVAGDVIRVYVFQDSGSSINIAQGNPVTTNTAYTEVQITRVSG